MDGLYGGMMDAREAVKSLLDGNGNVLLLPCCWSLIPNPVRTTLLGSSPLPPPTADAAPPTEPTAYTLPPLDELCRGVFLMEELAAISLSSVWSLSCFTSASEPGINIPSLEGKDVWLER